jgi:hypothetical protein
MAYINGEDIPIVDLTDEQLNDYFIKIWVIEFEKNYTYDIEEYDDEDDY